MKSFKQFFVERVNLKKNKWTIAKLNDIDEKILTKMFTLYEISYKEIGMHIKDIMMFKDKYKIYWLVDTDKDAEPDAFIAFKETKAGHKISVIGTDGGKEAKRSVITQLIRLMNKSPWYIEASDKVKIILTKANVPVVKSPDKIRAIMSGYVIDVLDNEGNYTREINNIGKKTKTIFGKPKV